jgi:hypothetical protein
MVTANENSNSKTFISCNNYHILHCDFFSRNEIVDSISAFMFLVGTIVLLATTIIDMVKGGAE